MNGFVAWYTTILPLDLVEWIAYPIRMGWQFLTL